MGSNAIDEYGREAEPKVKCRTDERHLVASHASLIRFAVCLLVTRGCIIRRSLAIGRLVVVSDQTSSLGVSNRNVGDRKSSVDTREIG